MTQAAPDSFVTALLRVSPRALQGMDRTHWPKALARQVIVLRGEATGGERFARETTMRVYAAHGGHHGEATLMQAIAEAVMHGEVAQHTVDTLLLTPRDQLVRHLIPLTARLGHADPPHALDYHLLYTDLRYHTLRLAGRWTAQYLSALHAAPPALPLSPTPQESLT